MDPNFGPIAPPPPPSPPTPPPPPLGQPFPSALIITPPKKSRVAWVVTLTIIFLLLATAGGVAAYTYYFRPDLIDKVFKLYPAPAEAEQKMMTALKLVKAVAYRLEMHGANENPAVASGTNKADLVIEGQSDWRQPNDTRNTMTVTLNTATGQGMSFRAAAEALNLGPTIYFRINQFPLLTMFDAENLAGQWITVETDKLDSLASTTTALPISVSLADQTQLDQAARRQKLSELVAANPIVRLDQFIIREKIGGEETWRYSFRLDKQAMLNIYRGFVETALASLNSSAPAATSTRFSLADLRLEDWQQIERDLNKINFPTGQIWLDKASLLPRRILMNIDVRQMASNYFLPPAAAGANPRLTIQADLTKYNQPVNVAPPLNSQPLEDVIGEIFGVLRVSSSTNSTDTASPFRLPAR